MLFHAGRSNKVQSKVQHQLFRSHGGPKTTYVTRLKLRLVIRIRIFFCPVWAAACASIVSSPDTSPMESFPPNPASLGSLIRYSLVINIHNYNRLSSCPESILIGNHVSQTSALRKAPPRPLAAACVKASYLSACRHPARRNRSAERCLPDREFCVNIRNYYS